MARKTKGNSPKACIKEFVSTIRKHFPDAPVNYRSCTVCLDIDPGFLGMYLRRTRERLQVYTRFFDDGQMEAVSALKKYGLDWLRYMPSFGDIDQHVFLEAHKVYLRYLGWPPGEGRWQAIGKLDRGGRGILQDDIDMYSYTGCMYEVLSEGSLPEDFDDLVGLLRRTGMLSPVHHKF